MINSGLGTFLALLILGLVAALGYYQAFLALITRRANLGEGRKVRGPQALAVGFVQLAGAIAASAVAFLFYFSQVK